MSGGVNTEHEAAPRGRRRWWAAVLAVLALVLAGVAADRMPDDDSPVVVPGRPTFDMDLPALAGEGVIRSADRRGAPLVVNFWASWCLPCRREMPALVAVAAEYEGRVNFVGVNHQDNREDAVDFATTFGVPFPSGFDPTGEVARATGLRGMPTTLFVDADGRVLERRTGELTKATLVATLKRLFRSLASEGGERSPASRPAP